MNTLDCVRNAVFTHTIEVRTALADAETFAIAVLLSPRKGRFFHYRPSRRFKCTRRAALRQRMRARPINAGNKITPMLIK